MDAIFSDAIFKWILEWKCLNFDQNFVEAFPKSPINNIPALV